MKINKVVTWRLAMLGAVAIPVIMELVSLFDGNDNTSSFTKLITGFIPADIFWLIWGAIAFWVSAHFIKHYKK